MAELIIKSIGASFIVFLAGFWITTYNIKSAMDNQYEIKASETSKFIESINSPVHYIISALIITGFLAVFFLAKIELIFLGVFFLIGERFAIIRAVKIAGKYNKTTPMSIVAKSL